jgi:peptidoglycan hydrolase-like protein with peptidoglycan-binding domain
MHPSGLYDGHTQRAVVEVQERAGLSRTGLLGPREWAAVWTHTPAPKPPPKPPERRKLTRQELRERRRYWKRVSEWQVEPGTSPDAPAWYPGRPFGPRHEGEHVKAVQEVLGFHVSGRFQVALARRVAGVQRAHGLPESGVVDARTATLIESLRK